MNALTSKQRSLGQSILLVAGIILISVNLRPALSAVGPLINSIRNATGLSNAMLGFLTTLPLLAFGFISVLTPVFTRRLGMEMTLAGALGLIIAGTLLRIIPLVAALFLGTLILGIGIAFGNVLIPSLIKRDFPQQKGIMTSVYSSVLAFGSTLAAGVSIPLSKSLGWRGTIAFWALPALLALLVWIPQLKHRTRPKHLKSLRHSIKHLGSTPLAWQVAVFMGLQSLTFYVILAWLPEILQGQGASPAFAGWMLSLSQGTGILASLVFPVWAERLKQQRMPVVVLIITEAISLVGLLLSGSTLVALWVSLLGFSLGGCFALALLFIVLRTKNTETATELSGMAQSVGYLLAATGPILFGLLHDVTHTWQIPLMMLFVVLVLKLGAGLGAARAKEIT